MSDDDEVMPVEEALRSVEWAMGRAAVYREQRNRYRDWFERLSAATTSYIEGRKEVDADAAQLREALTAVQAERDTLQDKIALPSRRSAESRGKRRGELREEIARRRQAGQKNESIAIDLGISESYLYRVMKAKS